MINLPAAWRFSAALAVVVVSSLSLFACSGGGGGGSSPPAPGPVSVSGALSAPSFNATDSDVNNPDEAYTPNNTPAQAQPLPNPAVVGGFVCATPTGVAGDRFQSTPDPVDYYRVSLAAGQAITLSFNMPAGQTSASLNLDLRLLDSTGQNQIQASQGFTHTELVTAPADGTYVIEVTAKAGSTNYILSIGRPTPKLASVDTQAEFVPGEIIVRFQNRGGKTKSAASESLAARAAAVGLTPLSGSAGRPMRMRLEKGAGRTKAFRALGIAENNSAQESVEADTEAAHKRDTVRAVQALRARADVAAADLNYIRRSARTPNDTFYSRQWDLALIRLPQAWDITTGIPVSGQIIVAVIDTGVVLNHPDLAGKFVDGYDFISDPTNALDGDGIDPNPNDPGDSLTSGTSSFHGTHVAGTIAAATDNGIGVAGISWGAKIMPLRVLGVQGGTSYDLIQAVRYAAGLSNNSGVIPTQRADIINLSLGGGGFSQNEQDAFSAARNAGVIVIAAAGNENTNRPSYPASYNGVISVSAIGPNLDKAFYSNFGPSIAVAAPGGDMSVDLNGDGFPDGILSTLANKTYDANGSAIITNNYNYYQGTSMAAPHVAGVVALMKAIYPALTPAQLDAELAGDTITQDLGAPGRDDIFGYGLIDALQAVQRAQILANGGASPLVLMITPTALNFGLTRTPQSLTVASSGAPINNVTAVTGANWLTISGSGLGNYTVSVNDAGLTPGVYAASIIFSGNGTKNVSVPVTLQVGGAGAGDAGLHYVLLIDPATSETKYTTTASPDTGYRFNIDGVAAGDYFVLAGSDLNNDFVICDPGEACGAYPTLDLPTTLHVNGTPITDINFVTGFAPILGTQATPSLPAQSYARKLNKQ
ncbi:MAG: S8 family serine peptidase [Gammaproteobacteria bacterium]|nr:S8 family serine peptidase [Gammaproteobacteria bacterium]